MDRIHDILNSVNKTIVNSTKETYEKQKHINADDYNDINQFELGPSTMKNLDDLYGDDESNDPLNNTNSALAALQKTHALASVIIDKAKEIEVTQRLTSAWENGKIDAVCKSMGELHDFVMNAPLADDDKSMIAGEKPGLWDNIRKKKEKMGKNYRPAKPGDKDRPDPQSWKKAQK